MDKKRERKKWIKGGEKEGGWIKKRERRESGGRSEEGQGTTYKETRGADEERGEERRETRKKERKRADRKGERREEIR